MSLNFVKMQAQGNDFVILDGLDESLPELSETFIRQICDRHLGIGCDQLLLLKRHEKADALMVIYNADGSQAANCGNGLRCVGELIMTKLGKAEVLIALADRFVQVRRSGSSVQVNMGQAVVEQVQASFTDVNMGNPHRVFFNDAEECPKRNVEIISDYNKQQVTIRIIERGAGETLACGSGACATAVALWHKLKSSSPLTINMPGGYVIVSQQSNDIYLEGEVSFVFKGVYAIAC